MAVHEFTGKAGRYLPGERVRTVDGSVHDQRLSASDDWRATDPATPAEPAPADHPAKSAPKGDWVDHAVDAGWDRKTADAMSKDELIALFAGGDA